MDTLWVTLMGENDFVNVLFEVVLSEGVSKGRGCLLNVNVMLLLVLVLLVLIVYSIWRTLGMCFFYVK